MRPYLKAAREKAELSQSALADLVNVERKAVSRWENGDNEPQSPQKAVIRRVLKNNDPHLFDIVSSDTQPCHTLPESDTVNSPDPYLPVTPGSVRGFKDCMDLLRRQFIEALAKFGGIASFGNLSLALVSSPTVEPEEYLSLCSESIGTWWGWLNQGNFNQLERVLHANIPILKRLATTVSPLQGIAVGLAVQAKIMQIILATRNFDYVGREILCAEAVRFGQFSEDSGILATALEWQGGTYVYCYHSPQKAIPTLEQALSCIGDNALLSRSGIYIDLSIAHAQDKNENNARENEKKARDYAELARMTMPEYPELDPLYPCIQYGHSELNQLEGKMYLHLAERFPHSDYAKKACDAFEQSMSKQAMNKAYIGQALIHKADAASRLGDMRECVACLKDGFRIAVEIGNIKRLNQAYDVMGRIPPNWKRETAVQNLQKDLSQALIIARR